MRNGNILIVDDDADIVTVLRVILEEEKFSVRTAYSGTEALTALEKTVPDLILLDYMLPDINGDEVAARIRQNKTWAAIPIVLISAAHNGKKIAENANMNGYVAKPFEIDQLLQEIEKFLSP